MVNVRVLCERVSANLLKPQKLFAKVAMVILILLIGSFNTGCTCAKLDSIRIYNTGASYPNTMRLGAMNTDANAAQGDVVLPKG